MANVDPTMVRWLVGEKIPVGQTDASTFFSDDDIELLIVSTTSETAAALKGWIIKTAEYARLVDIDESGSNRQLSQKYHQAFEQVKFWRQQLLNETNLTNIDGRAAIMKTADLWGRSSCGDLIMIANKLVDGTLNVMYRNDPYWDTGSLSNAPMVVSP